VGNKRKTLKKLACIGSVATVVPNSWIKPVVSSVVLPAHAQTSKLIGIFNSTFTLDEIPIQEMIIDVPQVNTSTSNSLQRIAFSVSGDYQVTKRVRNSRSDQEIIDASVEGFTLINVGVNSSLSSQTSISSRSSIVIEPFSTQDILLPLENTLTQDIDDDLSIFLGNGTVPVKFSIAVSAGIIAENTRFLESIGTGSINISIMFFA
jgi:hypothetical protein